MASTSPANQFFRTLESCYASLGSSFSDVRRMPLLKQPQVCMLINMWRERHTTRNRKKNTVTLPGSGQE